MSKFFDRHRPPHFPPVERWDTPVVLFVTVCAKDRAKILANDAVRDSLLRAFEKADHWLVGLYVVMPDHIHLLCAPASREAVSIGNWVKYWKKLVTQSMNWPPNRWQEGCWDTQMRKGDNYEAKWMYVYENPVRHGLVSRPEDWRWSGELNELVWLG